MSRPFDEATRFEACGPGRYEREIEQGDYWGMVTPHGGYLMALMMSAMQREVGDAERKPRALTQHFLGLVAPGRVVVEVSIERATRGVTSVSARMRSGDTVAGFASALFSRDREGPVFLDEPMPTSAAPAESEETPPTFVAPIHEQFEFRRCFGTDGPVVPVEDGGWILPRETGPWDHRLALLLSDLWIPPIIRHPDRVFATPSLHHVVHFGADVAGKGGEAFLVHHRLSNGGQGVSDEDIGLWAEDGRLLLRARQQRMVVAPETLMPRDA